MKFPAIAILLGVSLAGGAALGMLYMLFKKDEIDYDTQSIESNNEPNVTVHIKIPKETVGIVIGRQGSNIKEIQEQTMTKINFGDEIDTDGFRLCTIVGSPDSTVFAEFLIYRIIQNKPLICTCEMTVPMQACGRIIGRNGEHVRHIVARSGAKVTIDDENPRNKYADRRIVLKGTVDQMALAKTLINDTVREDYILRMKYESGAANRTPRRDFKSPVNSQAAVEKKPEFPVDVCQHKQHLIASSDGDMMEVYVSAVETPGRFWVQSVSPSAVELDQLLVQMTEHYSEKINQDIHYIKNLTKGQFVAATFLADRKWYRAQVLGVDGNDSKPENSIVELYYVDYGDSQAVRRQDVLELRPDFLRLKFQAVECTLAKVKPVGDEWSDEAIDLFEDLTHNAKWKVMMCSIDGYEQQQELRTREDSPAPAVSLFDLNGTTDINVAEELVKYRHAVYVDPKKAAEFNSVKSAGSTSSVNNTDSSHSAADTTASTLSLNAEALSGRSSEISISCSESDGRPSAMKGLNSSRIAANFNKIHTKDESTPKNPNTATLPQAGSASQSFIASQNGSGEATVDQNSMFRKVSRQLGSDWPEDMELF